MWWVVVRRREELRLQPDGPVEPRLDPTPAPLRERREFVVELGPEPVDEPGELVVRVEGDPLAEVLSFGRVVDTRRPVEVRPLGGHEDGQRLRVAALVGDGEEVVAARGASREEGPE